MKKPVNLIIMLLLAFMYDCARGLPAKAQMEGQKTFAQPNGDPEENANNFSFEKSRSNLSTLVPQIPPPPAVSLPEPASLETPPSTTLSWRSRALNLANEYPLKKNSIAWTLPVSYEKGQLLLKQAIMQIGLTLLAEYDDAGQFLVSLPESSKKGDIIVISQPVSERNTLFKMHIYSDYRSEEIKKVNCLPDTMKNLLENHGLWQ